MHAAAMVETVVEANMAGCWVGRADAWVVGAERVVEAVTVAKWADAVVAGNTVGVRVEGVVLVVAAAATAKGVGQTVVTVVTVVMGTEVVAAEDLVDVGGLRVAVAVVEEVAVAEEVGWFAGSQEAKVKVETVAQAKTARGARQAVGPAEVLMVAVVVVVARRQAVQVDTTEVVEAEMAEATQAE